MDSSSLIKEIGRSFIYSAFIPAAFFCITVFVVFNDFFPKDIYRQMGDNNFVAAIGQWILLLIIPTWIAFFFI
jgi:hypothetical protein